MPLIGPRLDAPTAIGDEGRPRATALWIASLAVGAVGVGLAVGAEATFVGAVASTAGFVVAGIALLGRDRFGPLAVGHTVFTPMAIMLAGIVLAGLVTRGPPGLFVLGGFALAVLGLGCAWANVDRAHLTRVNRQGWLAAMIALLALPVVLSAFAVLVLVVGHLVPTAIAPQSGPDVAGLALIVGLSAALLVLALTWLPIAALAPADRTVRVATWVDRARMALVGIVLLAATAWLTLATVRGVLAVTPGLSPGIAGPLETVSAVPPSIDRLLTSPVLRVPPLAVALVLAVAGAITAAGRFAIRWLDRGVSGARARRIAPLVGASVTVVIGLAIVGIGSAAAQTGAVDAPTAGAIQVLAIAMLTAVIAATAVVVVLTPLAVAVGATYLGVIPPRAGPIAVATAGLLIVAIGVASTGPVWAPIPVVVAALVVWDQGEFALGLTVEVGHRPLTRGVELVHASATLAVAAIAAVCAIAITLVAGWAPVGSAGASAVAVLAALLASVPLRR